MVMGLIPQRPSFSDCQKVGRSFPTALTTPIPVTTTRFFRKAQTSNSTARRAFSSPAWIRSGSKISMILWCWSMNALLPQLPHWFYYLDIGG